MTFMMFLSHGTQDLYPDFLKEVHKFSDTTRANVLIIANVGAVVGAILFGHLSQVAGRREGMISALGLSLLLIPLWGFGAGPGLILPTSALQPTAMHRARG